VLHVYALVRHPAAVPDVAGIDGAPLRAISAGDGIDAVVSDGSATATEPAILAHAAVVEAVTAANDGVLPARFAGGAAAEEELRRALGPRRDELLAALARIDGCVELGLRVLPRETAALSRPPSGAEYLRGRLAEVTRAEALATRLDELLSTVARESTRNVLARRDVVLTAAYLVPRGDVERFHEALRAAQEEVPELVLVATGPWPPYSFVGASE